MKKVPYFTQSFGIFFASFLLLSILMINLILCIPTLYREYSQQDTFFQQHLSTLLNLTSVSASNAVLSLDKQRAYDVAARILTTDGVSSVQIRAKLSSSAPQSLALLEKEYPTSNFLTHWIAKHYFRAPAQTRDLTIMSQEQKRVIGTLTIAIAPLYMAEKYLSSVSTVLLLEFAGSLILGLLFFSALYKYVVSPLRSTAKEISRINFKQSHNKSNPILLQEPRKGNELQQLLFDTNQALEHLEGMQEKLRKIETLDPLTGVINRKTIQEQLTKMIPTAHYSGSLIAVILIDLDRFKTVNDSLGHSTGDRLLAMIAEILRTCVGNKATVGRLSGDEFLLLMPAIKIRDATALAENVITTIAQPLNLSGHTLTPNASAGIALFPENGNDTATLMRSVDLALNHAKNHSTKKWSLYVENMRSIVLGEFTIEFALTGALSRNELELHLQAQFSAINDKLSSCEALLRWRYKGHQIPPTTFIKIAESTGLIFSIGDWVIQETCRILQKWGDRAVPISVNISSRQLDDPQFVERIRGTVEEYHIDPQMIQLEITETVLMKSLDQCLERLTALRKIGFSISIDDFGTGYSSLAHLAKLPIDELKIDRSFVSGAKPEPIILNTIVAMGRELKIPVVAEGVETEEQRAALIKSGCDFLQGFLLSMPMPVQDFEALLEQPKVPVQQAVTESE